MARPKFWNVISFYLANISSAFNYIRSCLRDFDDGVPILVKLIEFSLGLFFRFCGLSPCAIDLDDQTTVRFWTTNHRKFDRPSLVMIHGYGGSSIWQFLGQIGPFSKCFNLYIPDLLFIGKSYTERPDRSEVFQANCLLEGLKRIGVDKFHLFGISYGGFVAYRIAEMCPKEVEKVVIMSSGIMWTEAQKQEILNKYEGNALDILLPESTRDLRRLLNSTIYTFDPFKWLPDFVLRKFVKAMKRNRKEKLELVEHLMNKTPDSNLSVLTQQSLLIWGDKDNVFPPFLAHQLHRYLGHKSKLEIIKDTGHAVNMDSRETANALTIAFLSN